MLASNRAQLSLREKPDGSCEFLEGNECKVYESRPAQCRDFPARWSVPGECDMANG
jgi:Fe-S-cluster containining protein